MATIADLVVRLGLDADGIGDTIGRVASRVDRGLTRIGDRAEALGSKLSSVGERTADLGGKLTLGLSTPLFLAFGKAEAAATDLAEAQNATNQVFGEGAAIIDRYAATAATSMGLSERAFRAAITPIGAMLNNLGFSQEEAAQKAVELGQRAADMASVFNTDVDQALEAIAAGLRGEADPLEQFGVRLNAASIEAKAMAMGLADSKSELDDHAKAQAALALLMEQTDVIAGDFQRNIDGNANATRVFTARLEDASAEFGQRLIPIKARALEIGSKLLDRFNQLSPSVQQGAVMAGLFAIALGPVLTVAGNVMRVLGGIVRVSGTVIKVLPRIGAGAGRAAASMGRLAAAAARAGARVVAAFVRMAAQAAAATARVVAQVAIQIARWAMLGAQALLHAGRVAMAWLISLGPIALVAAAVVGFVALVIANWDTVASVTEAVFGAILGVIQGVFNWLASNWPLVLAILTGPIGIAVLLITSHWDTIKGVIAGVIDFIKGAITGAKDWIVARFNDVVSFVTGLPGRIRSAASGMWDGIKEAFKTVVNTVIGWWNGLEFTLGPWTIGRVTIAGREIFGGATIGPYTFGVPDIPYLAGGGLITGPTIAMVGEGRQDEAVLPLPDGPRVLAGLAALADGTGMAGPAVVVHAQGSILAERDLVRIIRDELRRRGLGGARA